jgi:hypothetical protein
MEAEMKFLHIGEVAASSLLAVATALGCVGAPRSGESLGDDDRDEGSEFKMEVGPPSDAVSATDQKGLPEASETTAEAAFAAAVAGDQLSFLETTADTTRPPITPPTEPSGTDVDNCLQGSDAPGGKIYNRFLYCMTGEIHPTYVVSPFGVVGEADVDIQVVAYGRDDGERSVKVFLRATGASSSGYAGSPSTVVRAWVACSDLTDGGCLAGGPTVAKTVAEWKNDHSWHEFTVYSNENITEAPDKVLRHKWTIQSQARFPGGWPFKGGETSIASFDSRIIRCDSATYFRGRNAACIHDEVIPHLQYRTSDDRVDEVAYHLLTAQENAAETWPDYGSAKRIPGKFIAGNPGAAGLHRVPYRGADPYKKNVAKKNEACRRTGEYKGDRGLPPELYNPPAQQCDEYPFATTQEGAASSNWDFSVLGVTAADNRCAGLALQRYYLEDRILYRTDKFFVQIHSDGPPPPVVSNPCPGEPGDFEDGAGTWDPED